MFGLGPIELIVIAAVVSIIFGPVFLRRMMGNLRQLHAAKDELTGPKALDRFLGVDNSDLDENEAQDDVDD